MLTSGNSEQKGLTAFIKKIQLGNCLFGGLEEDKSAISKKDHSTMTMIFYYLLKTMGQSTLILASTFHAHFLKHKNRDQLIFSTEKISDLQNRLLTLLFEIKHTAAIEKITSGLTTFQKAFYDIGKPDLLTLIQKVIDHTFGHTQKSTFNHILKRSACVPFLMLATLKAEPTFSGRRNLKQCVEQLIKSAKETVEADLFLKYQEGNAQNQDLESGGDQDIAEIKSKREGESEIENQNEELSEAQMIAGVHALNCLKSIFSDSVLKQKVVSYLEEVLEIGIKGFSSSNWSIRNSSLMLYTAVVRTALKIKNENNGNSLIHYLCIYISFQFKRLFFFLFQTKLYLLVIFLEPL